MQSIDIVEHVTGSRLVEVAPRFGNPDGCAHFLGASGGYAEEVCAVVPDSPGALAEVERDRSRSSGDLGEELPIVSANDRDKNAKLANDLKRELESDKTHESLRGRRERNQAPLRALRSDRRRFSFPLHNPQGGRVKGRGVTSMCPT